MTTSAEITKKAKSNLAFAFSLVPKERRADLTTFYAFCRVVDDLADDPDRAIPDKRHDLEAWRAALTSDNNPEGSLEQEVCELRDRHQIETSLFHEIIDGCESDLTPQRFGTWEDLQGYSFKVASAVGLISLPLFGASEEAHDYAVTLGHALQLTNILRDVGEDLSNGVRIYLPLADLARFQYTERDLVGRVHDGRFLALMNFEADRAEELLSKATELLPSGDRRALVAAEVMREIYHSLLTKMRRDHFRVFDRRYRLSKLQKMSILLKKSIC